MRALRFAQTGSLDHLELADVTPPIPAASELLIKISAAAVNPSDVKNVLGRMHETTVPRIPGRDFAGVVLQGPDGWVGQSVFGTGGNLGFSRDGSHAELMAVPQAAVVPVPRGVSSAQAAAIGLPYLTAYVAILHGARLSRGETILILGATGSVGSAAARLARRAGARVIGVVRNKQHIPKAESLPVDDWIDLESTDLAAGCRALTEGRGAEVVFDTVGGAMFEPCLAALGRRGRQVAISSGGMPRVSFNLVDFYHNESQLIGVDSLKVDFAEAGRILRELIPAFESGEFPPPEATPVPLERGPEVYRQIEAGQIRGKMVLTT